MHPDLDRRPVRLEDHARTGKWDCMVCCLPRTSVGLSPAERSALWQLRDDHCNVPFQADSSETDRMLCDIWNLVFPAESIREADNSKRWQRLGFQSSNPRTDVRTGCYALQQLHYFASNHTQLVQQLVQQSQDLDYPFAITCFNVTHMVVVFFDLFNMETVSPVSGAAPASLTQLQNFASLCCKSIHGARTVLDELVCALMERVHLTWKDMRVSQNCNLMAFPEALKKTYDVNASFWNSPRQETTDFRLLTNSGQG